MQSYPLHVIQSVLSPAKGSLAVTANVPDAPVMAIESVPKEMFACDTMEECFMSPNVAAAALLRKALKFNLPGNTMKLLQQSMPLDIVQHELSNVRNLQPKAASASTANELDMEFVDAKEFFMLALAAEVPVQVVRSLANALPLRAVQQELAPRVAVRSAHPRSKL